MLGEIAGLMAGYAASLQNKLPMETNPSLIAFNARAKALDLTDQYMTPMRVTCDPHGYFKSQNYAMGYDAQPYEWIATK